MAYTKITINYEVEKLRNIFGKGHSYEPSMTFYYKEITNHSQWSLCKTKPYLLPKKGGALLINIDIDDDDPQIHVNYFEKNKLKHQQLVDCIAYDKQKLTYLHFLPTELRQLLKQYLVSRHIFIKNLDQEYVLETNRRIFDVCSIV